MKMAETPDNDTDYSVPALTRGLSVLGMFNAGTRILSIQEIAERLGSALRRYTASYSL